MEGSATIGEARRRRARALEDEARARARRHGAVSEHAHAELLAAERAAFLRDPHGTETTGPAIALAEVNGLVSYLALLRVYDAARRRDWPPEQRITVMRAPPTAPVPLSTRRSPT